ncbi:glutaredoxin [Colwellia sp. M166]|uniref:glutaredoxin n=1 Tax=Colwellia sp. M166 TaxID=2583805 RepID=UPI00211F04D1|nr:glutaredoxin [Colwellia sp. M166]UUO25348.1 glutaredoxin [Colwellia sp. M166]|tara:strand:- start:53382 stop:54119 length:738 start_codon:yes stop_codon:yes gene_type:complete
MKDTAKLYRMHTDQHICPYGLRSKDLLERKGFEVEDHKLNSRAETDKFKQQHNVDTTPQTFIDGQIVGGYDALREHFDMPPAVKTGTTYTPVLAIFATAFVMALAAVFSSSGHVLSFKVIELFVAFSMTILAIQKLRDLYGFSNSFITYDLLAMKHLRYAYVYPFAEAFAGIGMIAGLSGLIVGPVSLFIGSVGAISVYKAVYVDKRELKCACVGGDSNVPLGFVSLTENLFMIGAGIWMLFKYL